MPTPFEPAALRRALVIKLRHHGDVLLASPVLTALKTAAPQCEIDALVYADTAPMLSGHPALAQLFTIDRHWKHQGPLAQLTAEARLLSALRARRHDLVIHLSVHRRGAWLTRLLRPRWSVAPRYTGRFWAKSFTHFYPAQSHPERHTVESNLDALRALGLEPAEEDKRVTLVPGPEAEARIDALLAQHGLVAGSFIHLHPASRWLFKCWPAEHFAALMDRLSAQGWPLVVTAAPEAKEKALVAEILARRAVSRAPTFDLAGQLTLKELAALTARARLFVGVDSAPMHIAAAQGTPTVAIFGPSGNKEWHPWQVAHRVVASDRHPCRPCGKDGCEGSKVSACLTELPVEAVWIACESLLAEAA
ncbi:MAG: putative lipopolysaccharide heptosyltransferase III [Rhodocyclaceae bacterium]|nr:putative lipopolysaccharide heptosyltransferase III [Rhodocyclaceae bacterium]